MKQILSNYQKLRKLSAIVQLNGSIMLLVFFLNVSAAMATTSKEGSDLKTTQQSMIVKGNVVDDIGEPLAGVSVKVKGTNQGTATDVNGNFSINVPGKSSVLVFSYLGYSNQEMPVGDQTFVHITMQEDVQLLQEVVVVGYGSVKQKDLTSSVQTVKNKDMLSGSFNSPMEMMNGKAAGVSISTTAPGDPNSGSGVQVRGASSIEAGNGPLIIIDGMPGGDIRNIAQQDIESITVLRDGGAAAIYGSRAANGVILIETKKGKFGSSGKVSITYDGYLDFDRVATRPDILSPEEYLEHQRGKDNGFQTDWYEALLNNNNFGQNHHIAVTGGGENAVFRVSGNYKLKDAIDISTNREEYGIKGNFQYKAFDGFLELGGNINYRVADEKYTDYDAFKMAVKLNPTTPIYDASRPSGYYRFFGYDEYNPVQRLKEVDKGALQEYSIVDLNFKLNFTKDLNSEIKMARQGHSKHYTEFQTSKSQGSVDDENRIGWAKQEYEKWTDWTFEWTGNYKKIIDKHNITALAGYSYQEFNWEKFGNENGNFPNDAYGPWNMDKGSWMKEKGRNGMWSEKNKSKVIAFFGRANYAFDDTYLLSATLRYEGNSKFGTNNKWGYFPSASAAWRFSKLFEDNRNIDDMKVRFSYGETGRSDFANYTSIAKYDGYGNYLNDGGKWIQVFGPSNNPNNNLRWEKTISYNLGLDYSLFNSKLSGSVDAFIRKGKDVISDYDVPVPPYLHDKIRTNVGTTTSKGVEFMINWTPVRTNNFTYTTNIVASYVRSVLDNFSNDEFKRGYMTRYDLPSPGNPGPAQRLEDGVEVGSFYGYKYAGVDDAGNIMIWKNAQSGGERILATAGGDADKSYIGNGGAPKWQWSWGNTFNYKRFDLSMFFTSRMNYDILNLYQMYYGLQGEPDINLLRDAYTRNGDIKSGKVMCDYFLESGNYFRLENLTLGWSPKINWKYIDNLRLYGTVRNVFTWTNYTGLDPANVDVNGLEPGIGKLDAYPITRTFTFGVQATF